MASSTVSSWVPPSLPEPAAASGLILLDRLCYIADLPNNTTAKSTTSTGLPIEVTFRAARPPLVSHFCVHCPGLDFSRIGPKIVATDADLVLLRVPLDPNGRSISGWNWDHFVYRPRAQWLDLVPNPPHLGALDAAATALISREDGAWFAVAALAFRPPLYNGRKLISWENVLNKRPLAHPHRGMCKKRGTLVLTLAHPKGCSKQSSRPARRRGLFRPLAHPKECSKQVTTRPPLSWNVPNMRDFGLDTCPPLGMFETNQSSCPEARIF
ncbi:NAD(P)-binding Rossmann-fold superfamily protein [Striga asiatica]|uniref:NAD(P)-binding Rossmann-fold superfamily protein n=1 Tax=Striga asiatica TaxID=4170 RepID=A0A5A7QLK0_STRAF|nr:NAD(P)-binding Rossmann-fold superfamily protein [Striga asiatica]